MKYLYSILIIFFITGFYLFFNDFKQVVEAVTLGDYNQTAPGGASLSNWNDLDNDFLLTDGSNSFQGNLNLNNSRINNLNNTNDSGEVANVSYVDNEVSSILVAGQGGDTYVNWGRNNCSGGDALLYSGYGFGNLHAYTAGSENSICIEEATFDGSVFNGGSVTDSLFPLLTGTDNTIPKTGTTIITKRFVKCAVCYRSQKSCYINVGTHDCNSLNFINKAYEGYLTGEITNSGGYRSTMERVCLNLDFDIGAGESPFWGATLHGSLIENNYGLSGYTTDRYVKCSVCCN